MTKRIALALLVFALGGCWIAEIHPRPPISVPPNLSQREVEVVILFDLARQPLPPEFSHGERIADNALKAVLGWRYQSADQPKSIWFTESVEPGVIYAGYAVRTHYIRVAIRFDDQVVTTSIVSSKNLDYSENRIHEVA